MAQSLLKMCNRNVGALPGFGRKAHGLLIGGFTLFLLTGCPLVEDIPPVNHFIVENNTGGDLIVTINDVSDWADEVRSRPVEAGVRFYFEWEASLGDCYGSSVVAADPGGTEVARLDHPACGGDKWIFEEDGGIVLEQGPD